MQCEYDVCVIMQYIAHYVHTDLGVLCANAQVSVPSLKPLLLQYIKDSARWDWILEDGFGFQMSESWLLKRLHRWGLRHRAATTAAQKLPPDYEVKLKLFRHQIAYLVFMHG